MSSVAEEVGGAGASSRVPKSLEAQTGRAKLERTGECLGGWREDVASLLWAGSFAGRGDGFGQNDSLLAIVDVEC